MNKPRRMLPSDYTEAGSVLDDVEPIDVNFQEMRFEAARYGFPNGIEVTHRWLDEDWTISPNVVRCEECGDEEGACGCE